MIKIKNYDIKNIFYFMKECYKLNDDEFESSISLNEGDTPQILPPSKGFQVNDPTYLSYKKNMEEANEHTRRSQTIKRKKQKLVMCVANSKYSVVKYVGKKIFNFFLTKDENDDWDLFWQDGGISAEFLIKMKPYQKINHFPGMESISRKNNLGKNLMNMRKVFSYDYKFFPKTWMLPQDYNELRAYDEKKKNTIYIVKPEASCQGRGIYLAKKLEDFKPKERFVVQKYIVNPFLIDNLKFDLRIYVLVYGCNPLRIFLYKEGLARFCTEMYEKPSIDNLKNRYMHLTNYAINKKSENFIFNEDAKENKVGHKRSLSCIFQMLEKQNIDIDKIKSEIEDAIIKTIISIQPSLSHIYSSCQTNDFDASWCFEILGFDFLLKDNLKPYLLEVNHSPSFSTDTPFDWEIKKNLIRDTIKLLNISWKKKHNLLLAQKQELKKRMLIYKKSRYSMSGKMKKKEKRIQKRVEYEKRHLGGFKIIYPNENSYQYEKYFEEAIRRYDLQTNGSKMFKLKEDKNLIMNQKIYDNSSIPETNAITEYCQPSKTEKSTANLNLNNFIQQRKITEINTKLTQNKNLYVTRPTNSYITPSIKTKSSIIQMKELFNKNNFKDEKVSRTRENPKFRKYCSMTKESNYSRSKNNSSNNHSNQKLTFVPLKVTPFECFIDMFNFPIEEIQMGRLFHRNIPRCLSAKAQITDNNLNTNKRKKSSY